MSFGGCLMRKKKLSLVAPVFQEEEILPQFIKEATGILESLSDYEWELILVDDGSTDGACR